MAVLSHAANHPRKAMAVQPLALVPKPPRLGYTVSMSRPCFCAQVALTTCMTLVTGSCGKGLFNNGTLTVDGGSRADQAVPPSDDGQRLPAGDVPSDRQAAPDVAVDAPADVTVPDSAPEGIAPGASITKFLDSPSGSIIFGDATLGATFSVQRGTFAQSTGITIGLVSLALPNDDAGLAVPAGPIGPVFSLSKDATLQDTATLAISFVLADASIPTDRIKLAYFYTLSDPNMWIAISRSSYDPTSRTLTGDVFEFTGTRLFAPVESCATGQACPGIETCGGEACQ